MKPMDVEDIVKADCKRYNLPFAKTYHDMRLAVHAGQWRVLRHDNSLLLYNIVEPKVADVHLITADPLHKVVASMKNFDKSLRAAGFQKAVATIRGSNFLKVLQRAKIKYQATPASEVIDGKTYIGYNLVFGV